MINGWQSYGSANSRKGLGGQIKWTPRPWMNVIRNNYGLGHDDFMFRTGDAFTRTTASRSSISTSPDEPSIRWPFLSRVTWAGVWPQHSDCIGYIPSRCGLPRQHQRCKVSRGRSLWTDDSAVAKQPLHSLIANVEPSFQSEAIPPIFSNRFKSTIQPLGNAGSALPLRTEGPIPSWPRAYVGVPAAAST